MMKKLYPIFLDLTGRLCLVVGGGIVALRKAEALRDADAKLRIVAPEVCNEIKSGFGEHEILERRYESGDLDGCFIAVAATDDEGLNSRVARDCHERGVIVNVVDQPADCDFYVPACMSDGGIQVAVSTGGGSPALAAWIKRRIGESLSPRLCEGAEIIAGARVRLIETDPTGFGKRAKGFRAFFETDIWHGFLEGKRDLSEEEVVEWISSFTD